MDPDKGYCKAKKLLKEHFGNKYRISVAYINKALSWPTVKADDGEALNSLALFLTSCSNAMIDLEYIEELDSWKVPDEELGRNDGKVWYIPHHGVYHPKKHKLRVVFDCGASYQGVTLNEQLL